MVKEVVERLGRLGCHGVPGSSCGDAAGVGEAHCLGLIPKSPVVVETMP